MLQAPNLDRHPLHRGQYIAYDARGFAFRISRTANGSWWARPSYAAQANDGRAFYGHLLNEVASRIGASSPVDGASL